MAFSPQQIPPIDLLPDTAVGINIPFNNPAVFSLNYQTKNAIKNNLINFFLTNPGEKPLNPTFGGGLRKFLFEQINLNDLSFIKEDVNSKLNTFFPNILINNLLISQYKNENKIQIILKYSVLNTNINDTLEIQL